MWFASGIVMIYVPYPSLSNTERIALLGPIDEQSISVSPAEALQVCASSKVERLRLISVTKRASYVCHFVNGQIQLVYADELAHRDSLSIEQATEIAHSHLKKPLSLSAPLEYDQWIVHQKFDAYRPFFRVEIDDAEQTHYYLSAQTGEFLQRTNKHERIWNYLGSVAHWIYPTVLRKHWSWWDQSVWWLSLFGIIAVLIGLYLGIVNLIKVRKENKDIISPFKAWMRWHHILGLFSGIFVLSWIFSGWLSMDHGRLFSLPTATQLQISSSQGLSMVEVTERITLAKLRGLSGVHEISFHAFAGSAFLLARNQHGYMDPSLLNADDVARTVSRAWLNAPVKAVENVASGDTYTSLREGRLPEETLRVKLNDAGASWIHVDMQTGEILSVMDRSRRLYRWLFNGLHSLDLPGLVEKRPLWDTIMLVLLLTGLAASLSGVIVGCRRLLSMRILKFPGIDREK